MINLNVYCKPKITQQFCFEWKTNGKAIVERVYSGLYTLDSKEVPLN